MSSTPILVHATPPVAPLPASDVRSIYLIALLQLATPGRWSVTPGDWAINGGDLPYITHLDHSISQKYLGSLPGFEDPDHSLSTKESAEGLTWKAYIEGQLTDLVNHTLYSLPPNYSEITFKSHLSTVSFPQTLWLPQRLRAIHKSRLQYAELWGLGGLDSGDVHEDEAKYRQEEIIVAPGGTVTPKSWTSWRSGRATAQRKRRWGEEELIAKTRNVLDPLLRRLGSGPYLFGSKPTTADLNLFSHLTLLLTPEWPNPLMTNLLKSSYEPLEQYHDRLLALLFGPTGWAAVPRSDPPGPSTTSWWDSVTSLWSDPFGTSATRPGRPLSKPEKDFIRGRWLWSALAAGSMVTYMFASGILKIESIDADEDEELDMDEEEEGIEAIRQVIADQLAREMAEEIDAAAVQESVGEGGEADVLVEIVEEEDEGE